MKRIFASLGSVPFARIGRHPDVVLAIFMVALVAMMIIPLPTPLIDVMLAASVAFSALLLVVALFAERALSVSSFPTLLLVTTLFRLGLNVSTTRSILSKGDAGEVVRAFGRFVVQGDLVVGLVIFLVVTLVQFLVIAKGAERVAEVAARFTLDAMPGKQNAIEHALRNGAITEEVAQRRREDLQRESQLFGAMDGAMKFVKGDAIAGLAICAINLTAGFVIGVVRHRMSFAGAAETYSILTIGDGLVCQLPALLVTLSAGLITTRVDPRDSKHGLGHTLQAELFTNPKVLAIGGALALLVALAPGMPALPFALIGSGLLGLARGERNKRRQLQKNLGSASRSIEERARQARAQLARADQVAPAVVPIRLELDPVLSVAIGSGRGSLAEILPALRDQLYFETGVVFPAVQVATSRRPLASSFALAIREVPAREGAISARELLVLESCGRLRRLGIDARPSELQSTRHALVPVAERETLEAAGVAFFTAAQQIALVLAETLRSSARQFVGIQEVSLLVERLERAYPALVREVVPKLIGIGQLVDVLRRLVDEHVSIRDLKAIVEALAEHAASTNDSVELTELVRSALSEQLLYSYAGPARELRAVLLDPLIEDTIQSAIQPSRGGHCLQLEPELWSAIVAATERSIRPLLEAGLQPLIITHAPLRRYVRKMYEVRLPEVAVLSYEELPPDVGVQPLGRVLVPEAIAA